MASSLGYWESTVLGLFLTAFSMTGAQILTYVQQLKPCRVGGPKHGPKKRLFPVCKKKHEKHTVCLCAWEGDLLEGKTCQPICLNCLAINKSVLQLHIFELELMFSSMLINPNLCERLLPAWHAACRICPVGYGSLECLRAGLFWREPQPMPFRLNMSIQDTL